MSALREMSGTAGQKNGPAEAATSPSRGSNNPYQENAVNKQHRTTAPAVAPPAERSIASMFAEWRALHHRDCSRESDDELEANHARYEDVQNRIIRATPVTPRDVAMQFYADTGNNASEMSDEFSDRLLAMALEGRAA